METSTLVSWTFSHILIIYLKKGHRISWTLHQVVNLQFINYNFFSVHNYAWKWGISVLSSKTVTSSSVCFLFYIYMWQLQKGACSAIKKGGFFRHQSLMAEQALFCNSPSTLTKRIFDMFCIFFFFWEVLHVLLE